MSPQRAATTMGEAIAISSPSGRMSKRARAAAISRLGAALFPPGIWPSAPALTSRRTQLLRQAAELRELAGRGMKPRAYARAAAQLEQEAATLPNPIRWDLLPPQAEAEARQLHQEAAQLYGQIYRIRQ